MTVMTLNHRNALTLQLFLDLAVCN